MAIKSTEGKVASCRISVTKRETRIIIKEIVILITSSMSSNKGCMGIIMITTIKTKATATTISMFLKRLAIVARQVTIGKHPRSPGS